MPQLFNLPTLADNQANNSNAMLLRLKLADALKSRRDQSQADQILPSLLMGLGQGQQMGGPTQQAPGPTPPMPGQPSVPNGNPAPITPVQSAPIGAPPLPMPQSTPSGGGPTPGLSLISQAAAPGAQAPSGPSAPPGGGQQQAPIQSTQRPGNGYELQDVIRILKTQYPNISGGALRNILMTINPLILTPQAKMQLEYMKMLNNQYNKDRSANQADQRIGIQQGRLDLAGQNAPVNQLGRLFTAAAPYIQSGSDLPPELAQAISQAAARAGQRGAGGGAAPQNGGAQGGIPPVNASALQPPPLNPGGGQGDGGALPAKQGLDKAKNERKFINDQLNLDVSRKQVNDDFDRVIQLMDSGKVVTGKGAETMYAARGWANTAGKMLGMSDKEKTPESLQAAGLLTKITNDLVTQSSALINLPPSRQTNAARANVEKSKPGLDQPNENNITLASIGKASLVWNQAFARFGNKNFGPQGISQDARDYFAQQVDKYPLTKDDKKGITRFVPQNEQKFKDALKAYKPGMGAGSTGQKVAYDKDGNAYIQNETGNWVNQQTGEPYGGQ